MGLTALALEEPDLPLTIRDYLSTSLDSCTGLLSIITQMMEFARIAAPPEADGGGSAGAGSPDGPGRRDSAERGGGDFRLEEREFSLRKLSEEVIDIMGRKVLEGSCELVVDIAADIADSRVVGDHVRLRQVLVSLVDNGVRFGPKGGEVVVRIAEDTSGAPDVPSETGNAAAAAARGLKGGGGGSSVHGSLSFRAGSSVSGRSADLDAARGGSGGNLAPRQQGDETLWLDVSVADGGFIPPDERERLFLPFEQLIRPGEVKPSGVGLGAPLSAAARFATAR